MARNLKRLRTKQGLSQEVLAEYSGTSKNYISQLETASRFPSPRLIDVLAAALQVEPVQFFVDENEQTLMAIKQELIEELTVQSSQTIKKTVENFTLLPIF